MAKIAILGWGSLLWDKEPQFEKHHKGWRHDGPKLQLEFSQIAEVQEDGIALVIDPKMGELCQVAYTLSKRGHPEDAICDLREREQTTLENIGYIFLDGSHHHYRDEATAESIRKWVKLRKMAMVVWTDTPSNFKEATGAAVQRQGGDAAYQESAVQDQGGGCGLCMEGTRLRSNAFKAGAAGATVVRSAAVR